MKAATAISRCEVAGKVYLPGDEMLVTAEQLAYLEEQGAARPTPSFCSGAPVPGATIANADVHYEQLVGKPRPKKGNRK